MVYMLDTDVCSYLMKRMPRHLLSKLQAAVENGDTMIAAHAMTLEATLITNNQKRFSRIAELAIVNWVDS